MKSKILLLFIIIALVDLSAGCKSGSGKTEGMKDQIRPESVQSQTEKNGYAIRKEIHEVKNARKDIHVEYPQVEGLADRIIQKKINSLIKNRALAFYILDIRDMELVQKYQAEGTYTIKLKNDRILSIAYSSFNNVIPSAHPTNMFHTTNIDVRTGKELALDDFVMKIDEAFVRLLKRSAYAGEIDRKYESDIRTLAFSWYESDEKLIGALRRTDSSIHVYVTMDALGISMPVAHVAGDHAEFEISRDDLKGNLKMKWD
jgi:hypothetical protein